MLVVAVISMVVVVPAGVLLRLASLLPAAREMHLHTLQHTRQNTRNITRDVMPTVPPTMGPILPIITWHKISGSNVHYLLKILKNPLSVLVLVAPSHVLSVVEEELLDDIATLLYR